MNPETIQRTQQFLFASEEEMERARLPSRMRERLTRLRGMYAYWLQHPRLTDRNVVGELCQRYGVGLTAAYEDLRLIKVCLGNLNQCTAEYYRYVFLQRAEEAFQMARQNNDARAFAQALATLGKYTRLDAPEGDRPDYSQIVPQQFDVTSDPEAGGFRRIPNVEEKVKRMLSRYITEAGRPGGTGAEEVKPLKPEFNSHGNESEIH